MLTPRLHPKLQSRQICSVLGGTNRRSLLEDALEFGFPDMARNGEPDSNCAGLGHSVPAQLSRGLV